MMKIKDVHDNKTSILPTLFKHASIYSIFTLTSNILTVITLAVFTRLLGVERFGIYSYLQAIILFTSTSSTQWIIQAVFRYRSINTTLYEKSEFNNFYFLLSVSYSFFIAGVSIVVYSTLARHFIVSVVEYFIFVVLLIISNAWLALYQALYQADLKPAVSSLFVLLRNVLRLVVPGSILFFTHNFHIFLLSIFCSESVTLILMLLRLKKEGNFFKWEFKDNRKYFGIFKSFWAYGWPMVGWYICAQIIAVSDRFLLQYFFGNEAVGKYVPNYTIAAMGVSIVTVPIVTAMHPLLMTLINKTEGETKSIENAIFTLSRYYLILSIPVALMLYLFRESISYYVLGASFTEGVIVFGPVVLGVLIWNFANLAHKPLEVQNKTKKMLFFIAISALLNIILELFLIPEYGFLGAAVATTIAYTSYPIMIFFATRDGLRWQFPLKTAFKLALISFIVIYGFEESILTRFTLNIWLFFGHALLIIVCIFILIVISGEVKPRQISAVISKFIQGP